MLLKGKRMKGVEDKKTLKKKKKVWSYLKKGKDPFREVEDSEGTQWP